MNKLFCFGLGFTGKNVANYFIQHGWKVTGTSRKKKDLDTNINIIKYDPKNNLRDLKNYLSETNVLLICIGPDDNGDIVLGNNQEDITKLLKDGIQRVIYLSTTAVYGDAEGKDVDEEFPLSPKSQRAKNRIKSESQWMDLCREYNVPCNLLRLSGIYGRGRNQIKNLLNGKAKRVIKEGQIFNRIHVDDITKIIFNISKSKLGSDIFNVSDDLPAPPQDVVDHAAHLLNISPPEAISFEKSQLSDMAKSFYSETKVIKNTKIKNKLNYKLKYPNYKKGLEEIASPKKNEFKFGILQVAPSIDSGGAEQTCVEIARELNLIGIKACLASNKGRLLEEYKKGDNVHINLPLQSKNPFLIILNTISLINIIKKCNIKLVHVRSRAPAISVYFATKLMRIDFISTYHGIYTEKSYIKKKYNQFMVKGKIVIANSNYTKQVIQKRYSIPNHKISIIHRGVDIEKFNPKYINKNYIKEIREELFLENKKIILLPGRITEWKGHEIAIEAFRKLSIDCEVPIKLIFAGDNMRHASYTKKLRKIISDYGLENDIHFLGHITDMPSIIYLSDIVLCPSIKPEAFGRVIAESLAMGRLVIASDIGPVREIISQNDRGKKNNPYGYLFKSGDSDELYQKIKRVLYLDDNQVKIASSHAMENIIKNFTIKKMCQQTLRIYASLLNNNIR